MLLHGSAFTLLCYYASRGMLLHGLAFTLLCKSQSLRLGMVGSPSSTLVLVVLFILEL